MFLLFLLHMAPAAHAQQNGAAADLRWLSPDDKQFQWLNVADWERKTGGLQPVRIPKVWRDKIPDGSAARALSTAGMALRLRTDSNKISIRLTFLDFPEAPNASPESLWERGRPRYFDVCRDRKVLANVPAKIAYTANRW